VLSLPESDGQFDVQVGQTRLRLNLDNIDKVMPPAGNVLPVSHAVKKDLSPRVKSLELDLRGKRADEVAPELDSYLNDVSVANFREVRIIHGFGTGVVRQIVRDILASHPLVKSFRPGGKGEGGDGVTVVEL
jgi:DNA mismatch repair protein MutS2